MKKPLKIKNMKYLMELSGIQGEKMLWWKKTRHGILIYLKDYDKKAVIVNYLEGFRALKIERSDGGRPIYDLTQRVESVN